MAKRKRFGRCHLCGAQDKLTWEHVPPEKAFNNRPMVYSSLLGEKGIKSARGMGGYTLCHPCNTFTGGEYGTPFIEFAYQLKTIKDSRDAESRMIVPVRIRPLPVVKQIVTMAVSANKPSWVDMNPYVRDFLLRPERKYLPPNIRAFAFLTGEGLPKMVGESWVAGMTIASTPHLPAGPIRLTEVVFPPAGFIITTKPSTLDKRWVEISHFATFDLADTATVYLDFAVLDTHLGLPGDYRTKSQLDEDIRRNMLLEADQTQ